jgi:RNA polymerase-binding transcription factor DksA
MTAPSPLLRFSPPALLGMRRGIMKRGHTLATMLAELLAGKDKRGALDALGVDGKPGMTPEEKARAALDAVEARRRLLDAGDDRFGRCDVCGEDLGVAALGELPWADRCRKHTAA